MIPFPVPKLEIRHICGPPEGSGAEAQLSRIANLKRREYPQSCYASGVLSVTATITDTAGVYRALLTYSQGGSWQTLDMVAGQGEYRSITLTTPADVDYMLQAVDRNGNTSMLAGADVTNMPCAEQALLPLSPGWNLVALPLQLPGPLTAQTLLDALNMQNSAATEIDRWRLGGWDGHIDGLPFNDFTLEPGKGYFERAGAASEWMPWGQPVMEPLALGLAPGWNLIGLPMLPGSLQAEDVLSQVEAQGGSCSEIHRWSDGAWSGHIKGYPFNNFDIRTDEGYFLKCTMASTYTPSLALVQESPGVAPSVAMPAGQAVANPLVREVAVTNRRDVAFSVTWRTGEPSTGWVEYGPTAAMGLMAQDERGEGAVATLHAVTLSGLAPETTYYYRIHAGDTVVDDRGQPFTLTTRAIEPPQAPLTAFGQVLFEDGTPAAGVLVRTFLAAPDGSRSEPLSALVDGWGYWHVDLPVLDCKELQLQIEAIAPDGSVRTVTTPACDAQLAPTVQFAGALPNRLFLPHLRR